MKLMNVARRYGARVALGVLAASPLAAFASGGDPYGSLVSAVNFGSVTTDVVAVAALVAAVLVSIRGVRFMLGIIRR
jgi:hypothetical protein